jgi:hypothetical protein
MSHEKQIVDGPEGFAGKLERNEPVEMTTCYYVCTQCRRPWEILAASNDSVARCRYCLCDEKSVASTRNFF